MLTPTYVGSIFCRSFMAMGAEAAVASIQQTVSFSLSLSTATALETTGSTSSPIRWVDCGVLYTTALNLNRINKKAPLLSDDLSIRRRRVFAFFARDQTFVGKHKKAIISPAGRSSDSDAGCRLLL